MFSDEEKDVIFIENAVHLSRHPHMVIECIPVPKNEGHVARLYFKVSALGVTSLGTVEFMKQLY